jgi:hypothetical protein
LTTSRQPDGNLREARHTHTHTQERVVCAHSIPATSAVWNNSRSEGLQCQPEFCHCHAAPSIQRLIPLSLLSQVLSPVAAVPGCCPCCCSPLLLLLLSLLLRPMNAPHTRPSPVHGVQCCRCDHPPYHWLHWRPGGLLQQPNVPLLQQVSVRPKRSLQLRAHRSRNGAIPKCMLPVYATVGCAMWHYKAANAWVSVHDIVASRTPHPIHP